jgi:putative hydrolase
MLKTDLHIHTLASGHAYSTILESVKFAADFGLETIAITDHGPGTLGGPHIGYFGCMGRIPRKIFGVNVLMGCEANVVDYDGSIDIDDRTATSLDVVLAGLHEYTPYPQKNSVKDNTESLIRVMKKSVVHIISHPYRPIFPVHISDLAKAANDCGTLLELNLSLLKVSGTDEELLKQIHLMLEITAILGSKISISSDAHIATEIGDDSILQKLGISVDNELVLGGKNGYNEVINFLASRR